MVVMTGALHFMGCMGFAGQESGAPDSTMVVVFIELHLASARQSLDYDAIPGMRDSILARHGLDSAKFAAAMDYYADHPIEYSALTSKVIDRLSGERHLQSGREFPHE